MASPQRRISQREAAAMAAARAWGDVFDNILVTVSGFLDCRADRVHMAHVNKHWRAAVMGLGRPPPPIQPELPALPPQLPWIVFPRAEPAAPPFYSPLTASYHLLHGLPDDFRGARWRGSGDGSWLVLAFDAPPAHALYNLNSAERIALPLGFRSPADNNVYPLVLQTATFSASPSDGPYTVAAIALVNDLPAAAFWWEGCPTWVSIGGPLAEMPQDVIYLAEAFYFVTPGEDLIRFGAAYGPNGDVILGRDTLHTLPREDYQENVAEMLDLGSYKRYLVNSRDTLLMVLRYDYNPGGTGIIRVFELNYEPAINGFLPHYTWEELFELSERMLFLGPGCSRSFEVALYDGFEEDEEMMYFLDETFYDMPPVGDDDSGMYTMGDLIPESWPLERPLRSNAPPHWWLH